MGSQKIVPKTGGKRLPLAGFQGSKSTVAGPAAVAGRFASLLSCFVVSGVA